jgi:CheY-like chemotaxis protein
VIGAKLVLYVEDNDANFTLVQRLLQSTGSYHVLRAISSEEARDALKEQTPQVILLDHELPGMLGIDFAKEIKSDPRTKDIPLILITASVMKREREAALNAGVDKFIEKPFDIVMLRNLVDTLSSP